MLQQVKEPPVQESAIRSVVKPLLAPFASLRLTVVLLAMAMIVIFAGTWAQIDQGIWSVQKRYFHSFFCWIDMRLFLPRGEVKSPGWTSVVSFLKPLGFPMLGGFSLIVLLLLNLIAAHTLRFKLAWKRSGIILIHAGLILLILGEVVTSLFAVEQQMTLWAGQTKQWAHDIREAELAVIDPSPADHDNVVAFPVGQLKTTSLLNDASVPFTVRIDRYYVNSSIFDPSGLGPFQIQQLKSRVEEFATAGIALKEKLGIIREPPIKGTDADRIDTPSAFATLTSRDGQSLGTYLLSTNLEQPQDVTVGDKMYQIALRFRRYYKPYTVTALKLDHDVYTGTDVPKNFSSLVRIEDAARSVNREVKIWMNHPLRFAGETFYQSGFDKEGKRFTTLQVVRNPGWLMPYVACSVVTLGLIIHFGRVLSEFLRKQMKQAAPAPTPVPAAPTGARSKRKTPSAQPLRGGVSWGGFIWPGIVTAMFGVYLLSLGRAPQPNAAGFDMDSFAHLPISYQGRVMPLDSLARNTLRIISGKATFKDADGHSHDAIEWLADALAGRERSTEYKVFRVDHPEIKTELALTNPQPRLSFFKALFGSEDPQIRFSFNQIIASQQKLQDQLKLIENVPDKQRDLYQRKLVELWEHLNLFATFANEAGLQSLYLVPPQPAVQPASDWKQLGAAIQESGNSPDKVAPPVRAVASILTAYAGGKADDFNSAVANYDTDLRDQLPSVMHKMDTEVVFNRFEPFYQCMILYVTVALLGMVSWLVSGSKTSIFLGRTATGILMLTLVVHTLGLGVRMYLQGRPPVTNLYSSAIFIPWAAVLLCVGLELVFRNGVASVVGSLLAFPSLIIAHYLAGSGDTMQMLQAVLDTNIWLATHVVVITLGYAATFLAGLLGIAWLVTALVTSVGPDVRKNMARMVYGIVCFAMLFSFVGTILGGIWADQSWGRFWGWDPKENGAVLIVLWNAIILHARWGGLAGVRGVALLAIFGNVVTAWSWFGTNMLGIGLHSYGFMDSAVFWLGLFIMIQLTLILIGWLWPAGWWRSASAA